MAVKILPALACILLVGVVPCGCNTADVVHDSMVQVWIADVYESVGVAVADGSYILTVINYEEYSPGDVDVVAPGKGKYKASIEAIDSRTSATLLKLDGVKLPPATAGDDTTIKEAQEVIIHGWVSDELALKSQLLLGSIYPDLSPLSFNVWLPEDELMTNGLISGQGFVVTDKKGRILGLESIYSYRLVVRLGVPGYIPPIVRISSMLALLSPDANRKPWANGPILFNVTEKGSRSGGYDGFVNNYVVAANEIRLLLNELGQPLTADDVPEDFIKSVWSSDSPNGILLTVVFTRPVALQDTRGTVLALAKWVGIQWDRSENKPDRVFYGIESYHVEGSYELLGDTTALTSIVREQIIHPYGP